jgi:hypothetical protein
LETKGFAAPEQPGSTVIWHAVGLTNLCSTKRIPDMPRWTMMASLLTVLAVAVATHAAEGDDAKPKRSGLGGLGNGGNLAEMLFKKLDADGNGKLTKDEVKKAAENKGDGKFNIGGIIEKAFDKLDTDKDGVLTLEEFKKFGEEMRTKIDPEKLKEKLGNLDPEKLEQLREMLQNRKPPEKP